MTKGMHKTDDWNTSILAAESIEPQLSELQEIVFDAFLAHPHGLTDFELDEYLTPRHGKRYTTYRKRRTELYQKGLLFPDGERSYPGGRTPLKVWKITKSDDRRARQIALGLVLPHFPGAKIVAVRDYPVQEAKAEQPSPPKNGAPTSKLPQWFTPAK